jgi:hypothetical protein
MIITSVICWSTFVGLHIACGCLVWTHPCSSGRADLLRRLKWQGSIQRGRGGGRGSFPNFPPNIYTAKRDLLPQSFSACPKKFFPLSNQSKACHVRIFLTIIFFAVHASLIPLK